MNGPERSASSVVCLAIGPIGDRLADEGSDERREFERAMKVLEEVIDPACGAFDIAPIRSDKISRAGEIPEQVFELIRDADIVIADLSGGNANVMYELGLRHATGKCTIHIAEKGEIPFDVSVIRTIIFKRSTSGLIDAKEELRKAVGDCLAGRFGDVTAARVMRSASPGPEEREVLPDAEGVETEEEPGPLEDLAKMEERLPQLSDYIRQAAEVMAGLTTIFTEATQDVERENSRGGSARARLAIATRVANSIQEPARRLEELVESYERDLLESERGVDRLLSAIEEDPSQLEEAEGFPEAVLVAAKATAENIAISEQNAERIAEIGRLARPLRQPTRQIAEALRRMAAASTRFVVWGKRAERILELKS